jgi:hypothetical protein
VLEQTAISAPPMQAPSKQASINTTTQLFKKQWLWLNPTFTQEQHTNNTNTHSIEDEAMDDDDVSLSHDNAAHQPGSLTDENSIASEESFGSEETFGNNVFADSTESLVESDYSCFTTSQQCVTSLMYLLDEMECPDYGFKAIMDWAHKCFEAGFDI